MSQHDVLYLLYGEMTGTRSFGGRARANGVGIASPLSTYGRPGFVRCVGNFPSDRRRFDDAANAIFDSEERRRVSRLRDYTFAQQEETRQIWRDKRSYLHTFIFCVVLRAEGLILHFIAIFVRGFVVVILQTFRHNWQSFVAVLPTTII